MAQNNTYLQETVSGVRQLTEEEEIRQRCQAREDYYFWERIKKHRHEKELAERDEALRQLRQLQQQKDRELAQKDDVLQHTETQLAAALARIAELEADKNK